MKKILIVFLVGIILASFNFKCTKVQASEKTLKSSCEKMVNFIEDNLTTFRNEYNKLNKNTFKANFIEGYSIVYIIDEEKFGVYLDFNDNNGYLVSSFTFDLYAMEVDGDLEYLKDVGFTYYSSADGFLKYNGIKYEKYDETYCGNTIYGYNGQDEPGDAYIYDIDAYMADRYPSYKLLETHEDAYPSYMAISMYDTTRFIKRISKNGGKDYFYYETEANCALTACFNVFNSWQDMGFYSGMPTTEDLIDITESIKEDPNYEQYGTGHGGAGIDSYWTTQNYIDNVYELYEKICYYATKYRDYTPISGFSTANTKDLIYFITSYYGGGTVTPKTSTNVSDILGHLDNGRAVFMGVRNSKTFGGNHAVACIGYRIYTYKSGVWIFSSTKKAYFYLIDDGHTGGESYIDPNCNSKLNFEFIYAG